MYLVYTNEFSGGQKTSGWLSEKAPAHHKSKFETNEKIGWKTRVNAKQRK